MNIGNELLQDLQAFENIRDAFISFYRSCSKIWQRLKTLVHNLTDYFERKQQIDCTRNGWVISNKCRMGQQIIARKPMVARARSYC
ncbi:hypothetical protein NG54_07865 [Heyndrickxia ginsengihumi]|uniref:Uncharacterized protein n=1 Tax=Heyndrickxia ginsengihumi TaxID=363870 RepID=A0A0A6VGC6_9BACI|nr:hypothetical protein [Heyndrickxia ginsengihumi]KHD85674.1 hypothetical protein NG54_07865 [Heyndrickxia ginsengihumi]